MSTIDHRAEAVRLLSEVDNWDMTDAGNRPYIMGILARAQIHASLATAETAGAPSENTLYIVVGPDQDEPGAFISYRQPHYDEAAAVAERNEINAQWAKHGQPEAWKLYALVEVQSR